MDEGRKRLIGIIAGTRLARQLKTTDDAIQSSIEPVLTSRPAEHFCLDACWLPCIFGLIKIQVPPARPNSDTG